MKSSSALITGLVIGAAAGVVAGAAYMKRKIEEVIDERVDEEVKNFIDDYYAKMDEEEDDISEEEDDSEEIAYNSLHAYSQQNIHKPDPTKIFRDPLADHEHPQEPDEETDILEENPIKRDQEDDTMKDPKLISEDKYDEDDSFEKEMLYYYQDDDVLTDEEEHEIQNEMEIVGDTMDKYDFRNNDEQVIHVRNFEQKTDYEIVKLFAAYH